MSLFKPEVLKLYFLLLDEILHLSNPQLSFRINKSRLNSQGMYVCIYVVGPRRLMPPPRMHCSLRLIVQTLVFSLSYLHRQVSPPETLVVKGGTTWARNGRWILPENADFHVKFRYLLHAVNLRHGTNGFTSFPKEGVMRIFSPWKIRQLRLGLNPRTWVPKASTLPLDHRSRFKSTSLLRLILCHQILQEYVQICGEECFEWGTSYVN